MGAVGIRKDELVWNSSVLTTFAFCVLEGRASRRGSTQEWVTWEWVRGPSPYQAKSSMAGGRQQGSRLQRPWSVYRANTFDLSDEMISMVLTGKGAGSEEAAKYR